jgi:hypothetical protein
MLWIAPGAALLIMVVCALTYFHAAEMRRRVGARHF